MNGPPPDLVEDALRCYERLRDPHGDPQLEAVRAAIFLEDVFGVVLTDADLDPAVLGSPAGVRAVVARHGGPA
jgi:hypothetical protein